MGIFPKVDFMKRKDFFFSERDQKNLELLRQELGAISEAETIRRVLQKAAGRVKK